MRPHQKLDLWKRAIEFVVAIYKITERFPKEEKFGLTSQLRRAAVSIVANIAEGAARTSPREFLQFLSHSQGSASEVDTERDGTPSWVSRREGISRVKPRPG